MRSWYRALGIVGLLLAHPAASQNEARGGAGAIDETAAADQVALYYHWATPDHLLLWKSLDELFGLEITRGDQGWEPGSIEGLLTQLDERLRETEPEKVEALKTDWRESLIAFFGEAGSEGDAYSDRLFELRQEPMKVARLKARYPDVLIYVKHGGDSRLEMTIQTGTMVGHYELMLGPDGEVTKGRIQAGRRASITRNIGGEARTFLDKNVPIETALGIPSGSLDPAFVDLTGLPPASGSESGGDTGAAWTWTPFWKELIRFWTAADPARSQFRQKLYRVSEESPARWAWFQLLTDEQWAAVKRPMPHRSDPREVEVSVVEESVEQPVWQAFLPFPLGLILGFAVAQLKVLRGGVTKREEDTETSDVEPETSDVETSDGETETSGGEIETSEEKPKVKSTPVDRSGATERWAELRRDLVSGFEAMLEEKFTEAAKVEAQETKGEDARALVTLERTVAESYKAASKGRSDDSPDPTPAQLRSWVGEVPRLLADFDEQVDALTAKLCIEADERTTLESTLQTQKNLLEVQLKELSEKLGQKTGENQRLSAGVGKLEGNLGAAQKQLETARAQLETGQQERAAALLKLREERGGFATAREQLERQLEEAWQRTSVLEAELTSVAPLARRVESLGWLENLNLYLRQGQRQFLDRNEIADAGLLSLLINHSLYHLAMGRAVGEPVLESAMLKNLCLISHRLSAKYTGFKHALSKFDGSFQENVAFAEGELAVGTRHEDSKFFQLALKHLRSYPQVNLSPFYFDIAKDGKIHRAN